MSELLRQIAESARGMERNGVVDESVLPLLDRLSEYFADLRSSWVSDTSRKTREVFYPYFAAKNAEGMLRKMRTRYAEALRTHTDNPVVAEDTLRLMPIFVTLYEALEKSRGRLDANSKQQLLAAARNLRIKASETQFLPSIQEELQGLDMKVFELKASRLSEAVSLKA